MDSVRCKWLFPPSRPRPRASCRRRGQPGRINVRFPALSGPGLSKMLASFRKMPAPALKILAPFPELPARFSRLSRSLHNRSRCACKIPASLRILKPSPCLFPPALREISPAICEMVPGLCEIAPRLREWAPGRCESARACSIGPAARDHRPPHQVEGPSRREEVRSGWWSVVGAWWSVRSVVIWVGVT
jgi:hypothetical protein